MMIVVTARAYLAAFNNVWIAIRDTDVTVRALLEIALPSCRLIGSKHASGGMGHTLADAIEIISESYQGALVIGLGDMPYVHSTTLQHLALTDIPTNKILRPRYDNRPGNPILFGADYLVELGQSEGNRGAAKLVRRAAARDALIYLDVVDPGVLQDIDVPPCKMQ
jgi:CTP:molybdopterin cytidylyltransferase MocA